MAQPDTTHYDLLVIGGGAAGIFGAIVAATNNPGLSIAVLESGPRFLTKVEISGGGRCNVTHSCYEPKKLIENYPRGSKELLGPFFRFQPTDTEKWFLDRGVQLKTESDGRVFPTSDSSKTIIDCFLKETEKFGIRLMPRTGVTEVKKLGDLFHLSLKPEQLTCSTLLLATGSSGSGHKLAKQLGHSITPLAPSLFTFKIRSPLLSGLAGTSFPSASVEIFPRDKSFLTKGAALITHWGLSGPAVLKLSSIAARELYEAAYKARLKVNWNHTVNHPETELLKYKEQFPKRSVGANSMFGFTQRFWKSLCELSTIGEELVYADISKAKLQELALNISESEFEVNGKGEFKDEFVTCGGVSLSEVNFKTMESKITPKLYFAGEILDIDGVTGGFNFQNAWTTAWHFGMAVSS